MAIFGKKDAATEEVKTPKATRPHVERDLSSIIVKPHMTEKAVNASDKNVYTFEIKAHATKYDVRDAVIKLFKVTPVKVNLVTRQPRTSMNRTRGRKQKVSGLRKAYVYLKKGDTIDLV